MSFSYITLVTNRNIKSNSIARISRLRKEQYTLIKSSVSIKNHIIHYYFPFTVDSYNITEDYKLTYA